MPKPIGELVGVVIDSEYRTSHGIEYHIVVWQEDRGKYRGCRYYVNPTTKEESLESTVYRSKAEIAYQDLADEVERASVIE